MARYDIFLSHASEEKEKFVDELYNGLKKANFTVWYDKYEIRWGDNLRTKITEGLNNSEYGMVVISKNYFASHKEWTFMEFEKILTSNKIMPILYDIDMPTIRKDYLKEYDKIKDWMGISSDIGIVKIINQAVIKIGEEAIREVMNPEYLEEKRRERERRVEEGAWKLFWQGFRDEAAEVLSGKRRSRERRQFDRLIKEERKRDGFR
jgi:hypothetical protein